MSEFRSVFFVVLMILLCWLLSHDRRQVKWSFVGFGVGLQLVFAFILLKVPYIEKALLALNSAVTVLEQVTLKATTFMFGFLAGGEAPFAVVNEGANFIVAFRVLPLVMFVSALSAVLFKLGVLPWLIQAFAKIVSRFFKLNGAVSFATSATLFLGTIEAPLIVRPYLKKMSESELMALICCSMATIAGTVMVLYASVLGKVIDSAVSHMVTASVMSIPAALLYSHLLHPGAVQSEPKEYIYEPEEIGFLEALIQGTLDGLQMVLQIVAIIIVLFAFVYLGDHLLGLISSGLNFETIVGYILRPFAWLMGVSWDQSLEAGKLLATKVVLNEFVGYLKLAGMADSLNEQNKMLLTYAMCGFANLASAGIILGGLSYIIPERRKELGRIVLWSILVGNLATMTTAAIVNILI